MWKLHGCVFALMICALNITVAFPDGLNLIKLLSEDFEFAETLIGDITEEYAVVFDAGSTGSRVHVFRFNARNLDLLPIGLDFEFYNKTKPGLSSYADNPNAAADSLSLLLNQAEAIIPTDLQPQTPVTVGATAGLRLLSGDTAERILEAVRDLLKNKSSLKFKPEWVSVIDGFQEGSYMWVTVNYLLETLGKPYSETVGVVDLGGASVQMAYAISQETAEDASKSSIGKDDQYLVEWNLKGIKYYLYAHSYLKYGLEAARAQILDIYGDRGNPCITNGTYTYSGVVYNVSAPWSGTNMRRCRTLIRKILNLDAFCPHKNCTFNGAWNGGGGDGQENLYVATSFYYTAMAANIVEESALSTKVRPIAYRNAAKDACRTNIYNIKSIYPNMRDEDMPFMCMDLVYEYTLLVDGFGIKPKGKVSVVQKFEYKGSEFEAAWPLGCALDVLSPPQFKLALYAN